MERTDVHRPSAIVPDDYEFVAFEHIKIESFGMCEEVLRQRQLIVDHMARTGGTYSTHEHGGNCMICGNVMATYTILFYHAKTNSYVRAGQDCAQKLEMSYGDFNKFTAAVRDARHAVAGKRKAQALLNDKGLSAAWDLYVADYMSLPGEDLKGYADRDCQACAFVMDAEPVPCKDHATRHRVYQEEITVRDIVGKLVKYGSISDKAENYLRSLIEVRIPKRAEILAQRAAEKELAQPCPEGRVVVTGTVIKIAEHESAFGVVDKMTVKATEGFVVWVTLPRSAGTVNRGDKVRFSATLLPSDRDTKFGFGKRPTKFEVIEAAQPETK